MEEKQSRYIYIRWFIIRAAMVLYDIVAVNAAYLLALAIRFYVASEFLEVAKGYIPAFLKFAPYYTVACIAVFVWFRLYGGIWKYAGLNDMNRILGACTVTTVIQVAGTLLFVQRMPITYYAIGAVIQFVLVAVSRFSYRLFSVERTRILREWNRAAIRVMIVGTGETGRIVRGRIEADHTNAAKPVCVFESRGECKNGMIDGIPLVSGIDRFKEYAEKYRVECVILADSIMPPKSRKQIKEICQELNLDVQDFSSYFQDDVVDLPFKRLMEYTGGEVEIILDGNKYHYSNSEQALMALPGKYTVTSVYAENNNVVVEMNQRKVIQNDLNEEWVQEFEQETGESVSFF